MAINKVNIKEIDNSVEIKSKDIALTKHDKEKIEAIKPTDIKYDWDGYVWPIIKKYQFDYHKYDDKNIYFCIPKKELSTDKLSKEHIENIKSLYKEVGWKSVTVDTSATYNNYNVIKIWLSFS